MISQAYFFEKKKNTEKKYLPKALLKNSFSSLRFAEKVTLSFLFVCFVLALKQLMLSFNKLFCIEFSEFFQKFASVPEKYVMIDKLFFLIVKLIFHHN